MTPNHHNKYKPPPKDSSRLSNAIRLAQGRGGAPNHRNQHQHQQREQSFTSLHSRQSAGATSTSTTSNNNNLSGAIPRKNRSLPKIPKKSFKSEDGSRTSMLSNMNVKPKAKSKPIPRKSDKRPLQHSHSSSFSRMGGGSGSGEENSNIIRVKSETPFIISVNTKHIKQYMNIHSNTYSHSHSHRRRTSIKETSTSSPRLRASERSIKRKLYTETKETDSDFLEDSDEDEQAIRKPKKRLMKKSSISIKGVNSSSISAVNNSDILGSTQVSSLNDLSIPSNSNANDMNSETQIAAQDQLLIMSNEDIEAPPSGTLPSLWYSREIVLHIWVIEKIIGWKTRTKISLQYKDNDEDKDINGGDLADLVGSAGSAGSTYTPTRLDDAEAKIISDKLINHNISKSGKRMEISRICHSRCPVVLKAFVERESRKMEKVKADASAKEGDDNNGDGIISSNEIKHKLPSLLIGTENSKNEKEEVLLIKWRGRSHLHCSWERPSDLEMYDTTNNTAKGKIKRYYQSQHMALGKDWRKVLEEGRKAASTSHSHNPVPPLDLQKNENTNNFSDNNDNNSLEEAFFQPDCTEVERIMACDENSMDLTVLSRQRALNLKAENEAENRRHKELLGDGHYQDDNSFLDEEKPWDPEDNVRYIVQWKGLQVSEITWEYWLHIKHDCVDQAEDFWNRQKAPDPDKAKQNMKSHPLMRDYKKLLESPAFGLSSRERPIGTIEGTIEESKNEVRPKNDEDEPPAALKLRAYQLEGVNWLLWNFWNKRSCILADEMGLGKTIQSFCFLNLLQRLPTTQVRGPFLVIAPLSLVNQWQSECSTWGPDLNIILYHGNQNSRNFLFEQEFYYTEQFVSKTAALKLRRQHITKFDILITTYEVAMKDLSILSKIRWRALIVDEAHRLKNHQSRLFADLCNVPRDFCLLLTGTPLQNSTEELWSLLNFSDPKAFASKENFVEKFGQLSDSKQVSELHSVLRPYLLRRVKEDVEKSLPPKEETILEVTLTPIQKTYYKAIYEKNTTFLFKGSKSGNAPSLMNIMMELRKCCNHPFLIKGAEERIMGEAATKSIDEKDVDPVLRWHKLLSEQLVKSSGKMVILMKLLPKLQSGGHKVLIFSQMVKVLDLLEELLRLNKYSYERLDGSTGASARHAAVDRFNRKSYQRFVMLLSTRAGGLGLNLTSADTVIIFDSDWNPQNDLQAMARAHRIGQTRAVRVYRLLTAKTYEMHMFHTASMKLGLDRAVLAHQRQNEQETSSRKKSESEKESQAKEIDELLKKGAYDVFRDDDDTEANKFMETDIDQLLERSSRTVTYGNTETSMSKGLGSFSKASFVTSDADGKDIDLDDPDFWSKTVGLEAPDETLDENIVLEKRNRKQVQVFDPYAAYIEEEQKKMDKIAQKIQQEKDEKKRMKEEKKVKREEEKERKRKEREEAKAAKDKQKAEKTGEKIITKAVQSNPSPKVKVKDFEAERRSVKEKKFKKEMMVKKLRRVEQKKLVRSIAKDDPILDRMKQAWETNHRDRVLNAVLLFGFGRFCKVRNEASLSSLPIQDVEVFLRSYVYQLGLQASISLLQSQDVGRNELVKQISTIFNSVDGRWVLNAITSAMKTHEISHSHEKDVRIPKVLIEPCFVSRLRSGIALSSLHCLAFMTRFNRIVEQAIEEIILDFGFEELGKRGCYVSDISTLDIDLKARHVTTEELSHVIGCHLDENSQGDFLFRWRPALWWDRSCDLGLIIGTFYHGLSNYQAIFDDESLPFSRKIQESRKGLNCSQAFENFKCVTQSATAVFGDAIAAFRAKQKIEKDKKAFSEAIGMNPKANHKINERESAELKNDKKDIDNSNDTESILVSILSLRHRIHKDITVKSSRESDSNFQSKPPMPSGKCLDDRLSELVGLIENSCLNKSMEISANDVDGCTSTQNYDSFQVNYQTSANLLDSLGLIENNKVPLRGPFDNQFLFETSYYNDLESSNWACMTTPKENRGEAIPTVITRHGLAALAYADIKTIKEVLVMENRIKKRSSDQTNIDASDQQEKIKKEMCDDFLIQQEKSDIIETDQKPTPKMNSKALYQGNIPPPFKDDNELRHGICAGLLCCGIPCPEAAYDENSFQLCHVLDVAGRITKRNFTSISNEEVDQYLRSVLIPHCLRLCLFGKDNGIGSWMKHSSRDAASSENEMTDIISKCSSKWNNKTGEIILPDPMCELNVHSVSAIEHATVILRRTRLSYAIQYIMGDKIGESITQSEIIQQILKDDKLHRKDDEIPMWWCPRIHDLALLQHASRFGLLTVILDRNNRYNKHGREDLLHRFVGTALDPSRLEIHIRKFLFEGKKAVVPKHIIESASLEEIEYLVEQQLCQFPSTLAVEQRLDFILGNICRKIISKLSPSEIENDDLAWLYFDLPMFEHDRWLRWTSKWNK